MKYQMSKGYMDSPEQLYFQNMTGTAVQERLKKNDIIIIPIGSTEYHGMGQPYGEDTFLVTRMAEIVAREKGCTISQPVWFGAHSWNQMGMPGTIVVPEDIFNAYLRAIFAGYWNAGFRKMILLNGHGQEYVIPNAIHMFQKATRVPCMFAFVNWPTAIAKYLRAKEFDCNDTPFETAFRHACEVETSYAMALFPELNHQDQMEDTKNWPKKHVLSPKTIDLGGDVYQWPLPGHCTAGLGPLEVIQCPEGVVGYPATKADPAKAQEGLEALLDIICRVHDEILEAYPAGKLPLEMTELTKSEPKLIDDLLKGPFNGGRSLYSHVYPI